MGNHVTCVEIDQAKLSRLRNNQLPIYEPGLDQYFQRNMREGRIRFTNVLAEGVKNADVIFLTLPTPPSENGSADLTYVLQTASALAGIITDYKVIVTKSTVPVGTADKLRAIFEMQGLKSGVNFDVVSNPEFLREGVAVADFMKPERVVIGTSGPRAAEVMKALYEPFLRNGNPMLMMDERSAEMVKYASNSFLATKISFMNEIANVCDLVGANVDKVRMGMGKDSRIGSQFLYPGLGYGGSCFPKDVQALAVTSEENRYEFQILNAVMDVNKRQRHHFIDRIFAHFDGEIQRKKFAIWGLAFKPNTDDVREAPSHTIIRELLDRGAEVSVYDPEAMETTRKVFKGRIVYATDMYAAARNADALIIATEWNEFRNPSFERLHALMNAAVVFDGRNLFDPAKMADQQFSYYSIGRPSVSLPGLLGGEGDETLAA
jgi:UDPglucose 6-dehydrogenase